MASIMSCSFSVSANDVCILSGEGGFNKCICNNKMCYCDESERGEYRLIYLKIVNITYFDIFLTVNIFYNFSN